MDSSAMDQKLLNDVETYGWHVLKVFGDDTSPGFGYSVGLFKTFGHPEIIVIGLNLDLTHSIINNIGDDIKAGKIFESGKFYSGLLEGFNCYFASVSRLYYQEYPRFARWFYHGEEFPLLQCIYPTTKGIYPWQAEWPQSIANLQPILSEPGVLVP